MLEGHGPQVSVALELRDGGVPQKFHFGVAERLGFGDFVAVHGQQQGEPATHCQ